MNDESTQPNRLQQEAKMMKLAKLIAERKSAAARSSWPTTAA